MSDSDTSESLDLEVEVPDLDTYSDTEKLIGKFHATMNSIFLGYTNDYYHEHTLFLYYQYRTTVEFKHEISNINSVTINLVLPGNEPMEYTVTTEGLSYQEIYDKLKIYRIGEDVQKITFDEGRNLIVTAY